MSNHAIITGNLVADPEIRFTTSGGTFATFRVASSQRKKNEAGEWIDGETSYFSCTAFGKYGEAAAQSLVKGTPVVVTGKLETRTLDKDGVKSTFFNILVEYCGIDIKQSLRAPEVDQWATNQSPF